MAVSSWPFDDSETDETHYTRLFRRLASSGVIADDVYTADSFKVSMSGTALRMTVGTGAAIVRGFFAHGNTPTNVDVASNTSGAVRLDRIVLRCDPSSNSVTPYYKQGSSVAPTLTQDETGIYELPLALLSVPNNATTNITVTDERMYVDKGTSYWTTATRPPGPGAPVGATPLPYQLGFNVTDGKWEYWTGSAWVGLLDSVTAANSVLWNGYSLTVSATTPVGTPSANRIWIQPTS